MVALCCSYWYSFKGVGLTVLLCALGRRRKQTGVCAYGKMMLAQIVVAFSPSHSEHQCKTRERAISREIMMLHLHPLPPAVFLRKRVVVILFLLKLANLVMAILLNKEETQVETAWILVFSCYGCSWCMFGQVVFSGIKYQETLRFIQMY